MGTIITTDLSRDLWSGKLTCRLTDAHSVILSGFGDPSNSSGNAGGRSLAGPETTWYTDHRRRAAPTPC